VRHRASDSERRLTALLNNCGSVRGDLPNVTIEKLAKTVVEIEPQKQESSPMALIFFYTNSHHFKNNCGRSGPVTFQLAS
jgi:hypothetical protein